MPTTADLLARTRQHLMTGKQDRVNRLAADMLAGATSCTLAIDLQGINNGTLMAVDLEEFFVLSTSGTAGGSSVSVIPGWEGSTPAAHLSGTPVRLNPHFSDWKIFQAINETLLALSARGAFHVLATEFDYNSSVEGYNVAAPNFLEPQNVTVDEPGPSQRWLPLRRADYYVDMSPNATDFPGGIQLRLKKPGSPGKKVRMSYRAKFGQLATTADNVEATTGLHDEGVAAVCYGAAIRLLGGREVKRTFLHSQPEPRRQEEVPPGHANQAMEPLLHLYDQAFNEYLEFLHRRYRRRVY